MEWYTIKNIDTIDSPSLVLFKENLNHNLSQMLKMVEGNPSRLMPHIKTNKMPQVIKRMVSNGIKSFKAATIAEAEMAATNGAENILIAHQLVGPKVSRFVTLIKMFPNTDFSTLLDNKASAKIFDEIAKKANVEFNLFIDINSGMDRTGIKIGPDLYQLIDNVKELNSLIIKGLHVYDGHFRDSDFRIRKEKVENEFSPVYSFYEKLKVDHPHFELICGGTPTFTSHLMEKDRIVSPGTCVFWDWNYDDKLQEQEFKFAVLLVTRVISKPSKGIITLDMGHKSIAPENSIDRRIKFLNLKNYELLSQSEEHGVLKVENWESIDIGDVFYGVPFHICPTVNLHDYVSVISDHLKVDEWEIIGRKRKITI